MAEVFTLFAGLAQNVALLLSLVFVYSLVAERVKHVPPGVRGVITGAVFGVIALIGMLLRIQVAPGVNFDSRNVAVALAGVVGGPASAVTAGSLVSAYRLWLGGVGAFAGVGAILTATALGALVHWRWGPRVREFGPWHFLLLGVALAASGLLWTFALPDSDLAWRMLKVFAFPVGVLYPLATMLAGLLLARERGERERTTLVQHSVDRWGEAVLWAESTGRLTDFNSAAVQLLGYSAAELRSLSVCDLDVNCPAEAWSANWKRLRDHAELRFETDYRAKDGRLIPVEIVSTFLDFEGRECACVFVRDITEHKRAADMLRESEGRYRTIIETTDEIIYRVTTTEKDQFGGTVQFVSSQVKNILGYQPDEFSRDPGLWFRIVHPDDVPALMESTRKIFASREPGTRQYRLRHKAVAEYRWMEDKVVLQTDDHGEAIAIQGAARDITERKRIEVEADQRRRETEILADLTSSINASLEADTILLQVARGAKELCGSDMAAVALRSPTSDETVLRYRVGARYQGYESNPIQPGKGAGGQVLLSGRPFRTDNYAEDPRISKEYLPVVQEEGVVAVLVVPIRIGERVEGLLYVTNRSPRPFTDQDESVLLQLADSAAIAIQNARLYAERAQAEQSLRESQRALSTLMSNLPGMAYRCRNDRDWTMEFASEGCFELTGYHPDDLVGNRTVSYGQLIHPAHRESEWEEVQAALSARRPFRLVYRIVAADRTKKWVWEQGRGVFSPEGELLALEGFITDITDRRRAEIERAWLLAESETRRRAAESLAEVQRLVSASLDPGEVAQRVVEGVQLLMQARSAMVFRLVRDSGDLVVMTVSESSKEVYPEGMVFPRGTGLSSLVVGERLPIATENILTDSRITLTAEQRARIEKAPYRAVLAVPLLVHGQVIGTLGVGDVAGRVFDQEDVRLAQAFAAQAAVALENSRLYAELRGALQELETSQQQLVQTVRLQALGELAAGVAHNFNNTLAVILGRTELLLARARGGLQRRELRVIQRAAIDGARAVKRVQEFTRQRPSRPRGPVDLNRVVREVVDVTAPRWRDEAKAKGISCDVVVKAAPNLPPIAGDAAELREALTNILLNALDAMPGGGRVTFLTGSETGGVWCAVSDTGVGMTEEVRQRVFDPFFTTKGERGSGLGLSVAYGIVARHGGEVDVQTQVGKGSTFTIRLPAAPEVEETKAPAPPPQVSPRARILVVDDDDEVREVLCDMLAAQGHHVMDCADGRSALARLDQEPFDLVLTDLAMPGLTGWDVAAAVKARHPGMPVVVVTGFGDGVDPDEFRRRGVDFIISKPFTPQDLHILLFRALPPSK